MNIAIITAGGVGQRMKSKTKPKQFLELHGKAIIIYTIEQFEYHQLIDGIIIVCVKDWIPYLHSLLNKYNFTKIKAVVPGGDNGQQSIFFGLKACKSYYSEDVNVLIHDGVRPLIDHDTISKNIECVQKNRTAITVCPATETIALQESDGTLKTMLERRKCLLARAPQSFVLSDILSAHTRALNDGNLSFVDSASLMNHYGFKLFTVEGEPENIKITTPTDFYIFRAMIDAKENSQIFG